MNHNLVKIGNLGLDLLEEYQELLPWVDTLEAMPEVPYLKVHDILSRQFKFWQRVHTEMELESFGRYNVCPFSGDVFESIE